MAPIQLRKATEHDRSTLLRFEQNLIEHERPFDPDLKTHDALYYDMDFLLHSKQVHFVVAYNTTQADVPIACGYVKRMPNAPKYTDPFHAYIGFMYTEPAYRGHGIAQQILNELVTWSQAQGMQQIILEVYQQNQNAVKAYEKVGFRPQIVQMRYTPNEK